MGTSILAPLLADAGLAAGADNALAMDGVALAAIAASTGTPVYVYNAATIRRQFAALDGAFGDLPHRLCYAVKANSNLAILTLFRRLGAGADIVSGGELLRVLAAGFDPAHVVFSGVGKTDDELLAAIATGVGHINIESCAEAERLAMLAEVQDRDVTVGVRVNPDVSTDTHPYITTGKGGLKFGVPRDQLEALFEVIESSGRLHLGGIAMHIGSQLHQSEPYRTGVDRLIEVLGQARRRGHDPRVLDIGGGLGIRYHDEATLDPDAWLAPIRARLTATGCKIHTEPGRFLVGSAGVMLTQVVFTKRSGGRRIAIVDAGMNDLIRPALYRACHAITPVRHAATSDGAAGDAEGGGGDGKGGDAVTGGGRWGGVLIPWYRLTLWARSAKAAIFWLWSAICRRCIKATSLPCSAPAPTALP